MDLSYVGNYFGGAAEGQRYREQQDLREKQDARAEAESQQVRRMRDYQLHDMEREEQMQQALSGVSEFQDLAPDATPDTPRSRRRQIDIDYDRAGVMSKSGLPKYLMQAYELKNKAYESDRQEVWRGLSSIASLNLSDADKIARAQEFLNSHHGMPGRIEAAPGEGGFTVNAFGPDGSHRGTGTVKDFNDLMLKTLSGLSPEAYFKAQDERRAAEDAQRKQRMFPSQLASSEAGARRDAVAANVAEGTQAAAIEAGRLAPPKIRADIAESNARTTVAIPAQANASNAQADRARLLMHYEAARDAAITRRYNSESDRWDDGTYPVPRVGGSGAGGKPSEKTINVPVPQQNGKYVNMPVVMRRNPDGTPSFTRADGKPLGDAENAAIDRLAGLQTESQRLDEALTFDIASLRKGMENGTRSAVDYEKDVARLKTAHAIAKERLAFNMRDSEGRISALTDMYLERRPEQDMVALGATMIDMAEAKKRAKEAKVAPNPAVGPDRAGGVSTRPEIPDANSSFAIPPSSSSGGADRAMINNALVGLRQQQNALAIQAASALPEQQAQISAQMAQIGMQIRALETHGRSRGYFQ